MADSTLSISLEELERAAEFVHKVVPPTPQYAWPKLRQRVGCTVWVTNARAAILPRLDRTRTTPYVVAWPDSQCRRVWPGLKTLVSR